MSKNCRNAEHAKPCNVNGMCIRGTSICSPNHAYHVCKGSMTTTQNSNNNYLEEILDSLEAEATYPDSNAWVTEPSKIEAIAKINSHILETALELIGEDDRVHCAVCGREALPKSVCSSGVCPQAIGRNELKDELRQSFITKYSREAGIE